jgi:Zn-finger nucleic acid-binding protein
MALTCPQCAAPMHEVKAQAKLGYYISLDQCERCGGIWCDRWELFPITTAEAERVDHVDQAALSSAVASTPAELDCPRCRARLRPFHDPALPADARIERCPNCEGMWLNRGELRRFKEHGHTGSPSGTASAADAERLARQLLADGKSMPTVQNLDAAFQPAEQDAADDVQGDLLTGAVWLIIRVLLRLLLHL